VSKIQNENLDFLNTKSTDVEWTINRKNSTNDTREKKTTTLYQMLAMN